MSPRFVPDPTKATGSFPIYQKGTYRVEIGEPKSFFGKGKKGENYGVRCGGKIIQSNEHPEAVNKPFVTTFYQHTEGAMNFSKSVEMAILGCKKDAEFDEKYSGEDWAFNTDDGSCGSGWWLFKGKVVDVECGEVSINPDTGDNQTNVVAYRLVA